MLSAGGEQLRGEACELRRIPGDDLGPGELLDAPQPGADVVPATGIGARRASAIRRSATARASTWKCPARMAWRKRRTLSMSNERICLMPGISARASRT